MALQWWKSVFVLVTVLWKGLYMYQIKIDSDGGYTGLVVAFKWNIQEDKDFLPKTQNLLTEASRNLYLSTRNRAYFKEITIAIPSSWSTNATYENATGDLFDKAHFRIDHKNQDSGGEPFTRQAGGCGDQGEYVQLSDQYVLHSTYDSIRSRYEIPHIRLVQEWARYRYGVFDEFGIPGDPEYPVQYPSSKQPEKWSMTQCTDKVSGTVFTEDGFCDVDINEGTGGRIPDGCFFLPIDNSNVDETASIMFTANIEKIVNFCDDGVEAEERRHNDEAPNKQNKMCQFRSTWDVVSNHQDFKAFSKKSVDQNQLDTTPKFRIVRTLSKGRYVLVLDVSRSMEGKPLELLKKAASRLLMDKIQSGNEIGIVLFSSQASVAAGMTEISDSTRDYLIKRLPKKTDGYTAIGQGLQMALAILKENGRKAEGSVVFLLTDGEENVGPTVRDVMPELINGQVIVNAVALGDKASQDLEFVVSSTGGKIFTIDNIHDPNSVGAIDWAFFDTVTAHEQEDFQPVTLVQDVVTVKDIHEMSVFVDEELGKDLVFTFVSPDIDNLDVSVSNPQNEWLDSSSSLISFDRNNALNRILVKVPSAVHGTWKAVAKTKQQRPITVDTTATCFPRDPEKQPIRTRAWFSDVEAIYPKPLKLFAQTVKGSVAVKEALVVAKVNRPDGSFVDVLLKDDGADPDTSKNDGIYTNYFTQFNDNGRYSVVVNLKTKVLHDNKTKRRASRSTDKNEDLPISRVANPGVFKLSNWTSSADIIPPSRITDLRVVSSNYEDGRANVTLQWTSAGNDMNSGTAESVDLRVSSNFSEIRHNFQSCQTFNSETAFIRGSLVPQEGGTIHEISLMIPEQLLPEPPFSDVFVLFFAVRTRDNSSNVAPLSNVARAFLATIPDNHGHRENARSNEMPVWSIIALGVVGGILMLFVVAVVIRKWIVSPRNKQSAYQSVSTHSEVPELPRFLTTAMYREDNL